MSSDKEQIELYKCKCGAYFSSSKNVNSFIERYEGNRLDNIKKTIHKDEMLFFILENEDLKIIQSHPAGYEYYIAHENSILCKTCEEVLGYYHLFQEKKCISSIYIGVINLVKINREKILLQDNCNENDEKPIMVYFKDSCEALTQIKQIYTLFEAISSFANDFSQNDISNLHNMLNDVNSTIIKTRLSSLLLYNLDDSNSDKD